MAMSNSERLITVMLAEIMEALNLNKELDPALIKTLVYNNDEWALSRKYPGIYESEAPSKEVVTETGDILWMWTIIESSIAKLTGDEAVEASNWHWNKFHGFDGNNDDHYGVAHTMINHLEEYQDFKGRNLNSHTQTTLPKYQSMNDKFMGYVRALQASPLSFSALKDLCS